VDAPFARLASREHAREMRARIQADGVFVDEMPPLVTADVPHTTNLCVVDASRTCVALTSTLGGAFGSAAVIRGTGILLANTMTWFDPRPGRPSSIAGGKRILWAPSPAVISRSGEPWLAVGGSGGRRLISGVARAILNAIHFGDGPQDAVNGIHVHDEGTGTLVDVRVLASERERLEKLGHRVVPTEETLASAGFGRFNAIMVDRDGLRGGVSRMRSSTAAGY
jgi:gamma-glutamyltranspeptidase/glutathione hydrolase